MKKAIPPHKNPSGDRGASVEGKRRHGGHAETLDPTQLDLQPGPPTQKVGLDPKGGSGDRFMSSDAAPALDQGISPTWTGAHHFRNTVEVPDVPTQDRSLKAANTRFVQDTFDQATSGSKWPVKVTYRDASTGKHSLTILYPGAVGLILPVLNEVLGVTFSDGTNIPTLKGYVARIDRTITAGGDDYTVWVAG